MTTLRPVTQKIPRSLSILEESSLPFSCVLTPYARARENQTTTTQTNNNEGDTTSPPLDTPHTNPPINIPAAGSIAKCHNCGAPLNTCSPLLDPTEPHQQQNHQEPLNLSKIKFLCALCGESTALDPSSQYTHHLSNVSQFEYKKYVQRYDLDTALKNNPPPEQKRQSFFHRNKSAPQDKIQTFAKSLPELCNPYMEYGLPVYPPTHPTMMESWYKPTSFKEPTRKTTSSSQRQPKTDYIPSVPTSLCPPILLAVVDANLSSTKTQAVGTALSHALKTAPSFCKFGLICLHPGNRLAMFDLSGPFPHLKHVTVDSNRVDRAEEMTNAFLFGEIPSTNEDEDGDGLGTPPPLFETMHLDEMFVTLDDNGRTNVESALRALGDVSVMETCRTSHKQPQEPLLHEKPLLGAALNAIFDFVEDGGGVHPGILNRDDYALLGKDLVGKDHFISASQLDHPTAFSYAGGKIMVFLNGAPAELGLDVLEGGVAGGNKGEVGSGGFGGSCAPVGERFSPSDGGAVGSNNAYDRDLEDQKEMDAWALPGSKMGSKTADYFNSLGERAALLAMGVELFGLVDIPPRTTNPTDNNGNIPYTMRHYKSNHYSVEQDRIGFGFSVLRFLSDRSGGCGPLLVNVNGFDANIKLDLDRGDGGSVEGMVKEVLARCPWYRPCAFGALLRIRTSPAITINTKPPKFTTTAPNNTSSTTDIDPARHLFNLGMYGSCTADRIDENTWHFGCCDVNTTTSFDLEFSGSSNGVVDHVAHTEIRGEVKMDPCVQTCFAYTAIMPKGGRWLCDKDGDDEEEEEWVTVRRLAVLTTTMDVAKDTESLTQSLDAEALSVVLFHKILTSSLRTCLTESQIIGKEWLLNTLFATYLSAKSHAKRLKSNSRHTFQPSASNSETSQRFFVKERILNAGGQISNRDVLLAQGHDRICSLPLLVFSLLQCDGLRPSSENGYHPSVDARVCTCTNMGIMNPGDMSRCIAPRLELWGDDTAASGKEENGEGPTVESVNLSKHALELAFEDLQKDRANVTSGSGSSIPLFFLDSPRQILVFPHPSFQRNKNGNGSDIYISEALNKTVKEAARSYRVFPPVYYCNQDNNMKNDSFLRILNDAMVEDSMNDGMSNFEDWCTDIADMLHEELMSRKNSNER